MRLATTQFSSEKTNARYNNWVFNIFCLSTLFMWIFSVKAIQSWPPLIGKVSVFLACTLPAAMIASSQVPIYFRKKKVPKEMLWALLIFILGLTSSLLSKTSLISLKATILFMASGPLIFITTTYLFKSVRNQTVFLWMSSLSLLCFGILGIYEFNNYEWITLFSNNPLPAGALLALLSAGPIVLLAQKHSAVSRTILVFSLILAITIIALLAKKGPILNLVVIFLFWLGFVNLRYFKLFLGLVFLVGSLLYFSGSTQSKYKSFAELENAETNYVQNITLSVMLRVEYMFFGFHIFKESPIWGIGSRPDLNPYFDNYKIKLPENLMSKAYFFNASVRDRSFENIFLTFLVEMGSLFTIIYFGGLLYIMVRYLKSSRPPSKDIVVISLLSVMVGFSVISCTFDTLRFPNLNWLFHSLLGLMVNMPQRSVGEPPVPS
jgi:hypothetical protein